MEASTESPAMGTMSTMSTVSAGGLEGFSKTSISSSSDDTRSPVSEVEVWVWVVEMERSVDRSSESPRDPASRSASAAVSRQGSLHLRSAVQCSAVRCGAV